MEDSRSHSSVTAAIYAPIGEKALVSRIRQRLEDAIATGVLAPGDRLPGNRRWHHGSGFHSSPSEKRSSICAPPICSTPSKGGWRQLRGSRFQSAHALLEPRIAALSRAEITDLATYYRTIADGVLRTISAMGLEENLAQIPLTALPLGRCKVAWICGWQVSPNQCVWFTNRSESRMISVHFSGSDWMTLSSAIHLRPQPDNA